MSVNSSARCQKICGPCGVLLREKPHLIGPSPLRTRLSRRRANGRPVTATCVGRAKIRCLLHPAQGRPQSGWDQSVSPRDGGRVKVGFGLACGGGGGPAGSGRGSHAHRSYPSLPQFPAPPPPPPPIEHRSLHVGQAVLLIERRKVFACSCGDTCICSVEGGVPLGPFH